MDWQDSDLRPATRTPIAAYWTPLSESTSSTRQPLGIVHATNYDGKDGPEGHPDLKGFGRDDHVFFWLRHGDADAMAAHIGFVAKSEAEVNAFYEAAMAAGATDNGKPGARLYYDPRYCERF